MKKWLIKVTILITCVFLGYSWIFGIEDFENRVAYKTKSYDKKVNVEVDHIYKEKGKETIYEIDTWYNDENISIPESMYLEYIGDENNTITVRYEELYIYLATAKFGYSFDKSVVWSFTRTFYPWESTKTFSTEEIESAIEAIEKEFERTGAYSGKWDFEFTYDEFHHGNTNFNCIEKGAAQYRKGVLSEKN